MDMIFIEGLTLSASIGVHPWEKQVRQPVEIEIHLASDMAIAAKKDQLCDALDYEAVANAIEAFLSAHSFALLETLGIKLIQHLFAHFPIRFISVKLTKRSALVHARNVGVKLERTREQMEGLG